MIDLVLALSTECCVVSLSFVSFDFEGLWLMRQFMLQKKWKSLWCTCWSQRLQACVFWERKTGRESLKGFRSKSWWQKMSLDWQSFQVMLTKSFNKSSFCIARNKSRFDDFEEILDSKVGQGQKPNQTEGKVGLTWLLIVSFDESTRWKCAFLGKRSHFVDELLGVNLTEAVRQFSSTCASIQQKLFVNSAAAVLQFGKSFYNNL